MIRSRDLAAALALLAAAATTFAAAAGEEAPYTVEDLGFLGPSASFTRANGINDAGQVVGTSFVTGVGERAFLWLPRPAFGLGPGIHDLGTLGGARAQALDVDPFGRVVGFSDVADPMSFLGHAFSWQDGVMTDLGLLPGQVGAGANAINRHGDVVGEAGSGFNCIPVIWLPEPRYGLPAGINELPRTGGLNDALALDVNDRGEVVGQMKTACDFPFVDHPWLWLPQPAYGLPAGSHDLNPGAPAGIFDVAEAINEFGEIVGWRTPDSFDTAEPWLWRDGAFAPLPLPPGLTSAMALDINDRGDAVGQGREGAALSPRRAVLWANGEAVDLNELIPPDSGWVLEGATAINERGQIVGAGVHDGQRRAFLLTLPGAISPLEIPALGAVGAALLALLLAAAGAALLARRRRSATR